MSVGKQEGTWIQCANCGKIYYIYRKVPIDKLYITSECARCGYDRGLNLGDKEENIYCYYDPNLDERYYIY